MIDRIALAVQRALSMAAALTSPKPDVAASDRAVETTLRRSRLFRALDTGGSDIRRAWPDARIRTFWLELLHGWNSLTGPERVRAVGIVAFVAGITAVLVQFAGTASARTLIWVVPATVAALGLGASLAADSLARAIADRSS
jgi:hypothetical protein